MTRWLWTSGFILGLKQSWLIGHIQSCQKAFLGLAEANLDAIMPGYTHMQRAQPVLFSHWCLAYVEMLARDQQRMQQLVKTLNAECPLGAGALAGSTLPLDRHFVAKKLGF